MFRALLFLTAASAADLPPLATPAADTSAITEPCSCGSLVVRRAIAATEETWNFDVDPTFESRVEAMRGIVSAWPSDVEANVAWQAAPPGGQRQLEALQAEYRSRRNAAPGDPALAFLAGRLEVPESAARIARTIVERWPASPWGHLLAAEAESRRASPDPTTLKASLERFFSRCPESALGAELAVRVPDRAFVSRVASRLRALLVREPSLAARWSQVWTLEFLAAPVEEHPSVRARVRRDVERLWSLLASPTFAAVVLEGARLVDDPDLRRSAEDEILKRRPGSWDAFLVARGRFERLHPYSGVSTSDAERTAFFQRLFDETTDWVERWPDHPLAWETRRFALANLPEAPDVVAARAGDRLLAALEVRPLDVTSHEYPFPIRVADLWLARGIRLREALRLADTVVPAEEESLLRGARGTAADFREVVEDVEWLAKTVRVEADARLGRLGEAKAALAAMSAASEVEPTGDAATARQRWSARKALVHRARAGVALAEGRPSEALGEYRKAILDIPPDLRQIPVAAEAARRARLLLPRERRGAEAFDRWLALAGGRDVAAAPGWEKRALKLSDVELRTLDGATIRFGSLRGKSLFVCVWATWCGPCRAELPFVKALHESLRGRRDVAVVTLNVDGNPGAVAPFVRDSGYRFPVVFGGELVRATYGGDVSIPRSWIVSPDGVVVLERQGFGSGETVRHFVETTRALLDSSVDGRGRSRRSRRRDAGEIFVPDPPKR